MTDNNSTSTSTSTSTDPQLTMNDTTPPIPQPAQPVCAHCAKSTPLKPCSKCHSVQYCSRECLKADKTHKKVCAAAAQLYAMTADVKPQGPRTVPKEGHRKGLQKWQFDT